MNSPRDVIDFWTARLEGDPGAAAAIDAVYKMVVEGPDGGTWILHCREPAHVREGEGAADCTVTVSSSDFMSLALGQMNPQLAFMRGKLKLGGDLTQALKLHRVFEQRRVH